MRTIITTYYAPSADAENKPVVKMNRGSRRDEILPNICRHLTRNDYGADVASVHDEETGELLLVVTYFIGASLQVAFEPDVSRPVCVTNITE